MSSALRLFGLKAVVTDAGSGIGEAIARTLVKHGAKVLAVDAPSSASLRSCLCPVALSGSCYGMCRR